MKLQKIIKGCMSRDPKSQRLLVDTFSDLLFAICIRYMGDRATAKDLLQISLLKILQNIDSYDSSKGKLESWMTTITINSCLSQLRRRTATVVDLEEVRAADVSVAEETIADMSAKEILALVAELPTLYREVFNLVAIDGYSHAEVAVMLGIGEETSRARLSRAKKALRLLLLKMEKKESCTILG